MFQDQTGAFSDQIQRNYPDERVKLRTKGSFLDTFPGAKDGEMDILKNDRGIIFPYTPTIMLQHQASYQDHQPVHSNFAYKYFQNYSIPDFTVTGRFTCHTINEGIHSAACYHFLKSAMKIGFGENDDQRGVPPPVLRFDAYGPGIARNWSVVVTGVMLNLDPGCDYVWATLETKLPISFEMIITLGITYNTQRTRTEFTSKDFYSGALLKNGYS